MEEAETERSIANRIINAIMEKSVPPQPGSGLGSRPSRAPRRITSQLILEGREEVSGRKERGGRAWSCFKNGRWGAATISAASEARLGTNLGPSKGNSALEQESE